MKTSVFSRVRSTSENFNVFITRDKIFLWYSLKKSKFSFYFFVYTPMRHQTKHERHGVDAQCLTCETLERRQKKKKKKKKKKKIGKSK